MTLTGTGYAKINLALHVRRRREDGYHELETLFAFARDGDAIAIDTDGAPGLTIDGPFSDALAGEAGDDNLVMRAARALGRPAAIRLTKTLPIAAGIGGGSADAAAVLRLLGEGHDEAELLAIAAGLGADVPACVASVPVRGDGRGDELRAIEAAGLSAMPLLLVNPRVPLSTGPVFRAWDGRDRGALGEGDPLAVALAGRNDLEAPALGLCPVIGEVLALLRAQDGVTLARMSGSGATCFALFESEAWRDAADAAIGNERPDWWRLATALR
ncbi:4-(cytidine 5'-diphospho)-2-C-methyl-D-erythritol kinase [Sphingomonas montanisoli]|uniref:4-diphosphocytidyl-2-C-methyl-D-erythritol kinase n=1 Tax=Sphingomonas montanisoli TaxID=2606412 RepID=A0A5D9C8J6_9SPHN|nr:4-(cytidine 5'-diphospho)-2-C-methyl-D-erythritol kinase [Sphingomonas montanisoli]TZG28049.1 4-(cytidine 5'-diphospho)-2-C-methyl-D-erythritol kinase [Sphingomonas montanisoli]